MCCLGANIYSLGANIIFLALLKLPHLTGCKHFQKCLQDNTYNRRFFSIEILYLRVNSHILFKMIEVLSVSLTAWNASWSKKALSIYYSCVVICYAPMSLWEDCKEFAEKYGFAAENIVKSPYVTLTRQRIRLLTFLRPVLGQICRVKAFQIT